MRLSKAALLVGAMLGSLAISSTARADIGFRGGLAMGLWRSGFLQTNGTQDSTASTIPSLGLEFEAGLQASIVYVEYTAHWFLPTYTPPDRLHDAHDFSPWGVNVGVDLRPVPLEIYGGLEASGYGLSGGAGPDYSGMAWKVGTNIYLYAPASRWLRLGLKAEYRHATLGEDQAGALPAGVDTTADIYFIGLTIGNG